MAESPSNADAGAGTAPTGSITYSFGLATGLN